MLGSFHDLVKPQSPKVIRPQMIEYFNSQVPEGYQYKLDERGHDICWLVPKESRAITIGNLQARLTDRQREMLKGEDNNARALSLLMQNCLEKIDVDASAAKVTLSGAEYPTDVLAHKVDDNELKSSRTFLFALPNELDLPLVSGSTHLKVHCVQKPSNNIHARRYESKGSPLAINFELNDKNLSGHYSFRFDNAQSPSIEICLDAAIVYDGLSDGTTSIEGMPSFTGAKDTRKEKGPIAPFWRDTLAVQRALGARFQCDEPVDRETLVGIDRLHTCLCEGKAVGLGYKPDSITIASDNPPAQEGSGGVCRLMFPSNKLLKVFGEEIEVYACIGLSGIILGKPELVNKEGNKYSYPITYSDDYQCSILYCPTNNTDDSEENVQRISEIVFAPLPNGRRY